MSEDKQQTAFDDFDPSVYNTTDKEVIKKEFRRCKRDVAYFINNYIIIQHPTKGKIPFKLWEFQKSTINEFLNNRYSIILKARQLGISTLVAAYGLWLCLFHSDKNVLCLATKSDVAQNIITKVDMMLTNLPKWMPYKLIDDNKKTKSFKNGSQIKAIPTTESAGRSEALSLLIVDEAAFIDKMDDIWAAAHNTLSTGGDCIVLSTPNGIGNWFHKVFSEAESQLNDFRAITLHWSVHPERDLAWRKHQDKVQDPKLAAQEHDCDFITSGDNVFDLTLIKEKYEPMCKEPLYKEVEDRRLFVFEPPDFNDRDYIVSADVALGDGSDYSTAIVIKVALPDEREKDKVVAVYKGRIQTDKFGELLDKIGRHYNNALIIVENNSVGVAPLQKLLDLEYPNLYYTPKGQSYTYDFVNKLTDLEKIKYDGRPGITTSMKTRPAFIGNMAHAIANETIEFYDKRIIDEIYTFVYENGRPQARQGYNDDLIMALAIGLWIRDVAYKIQMLKRQSAIARLDSMDFDNSNILPVYKSDRFKQNPYEIDVGTGMNTVKEDIRWLFD